MAVSTRTKKTLDVELANAKTYVHPSGVTFEKGIKYTLSEKDAKSLLSLSNEYGIPYFRPYRSPEEKKPVRREDQAKPAAEGVMTLPDRMKTGDRDTGKDEVEPATKPPAPEVVSTEGQSVNDDQASDGGQEGDGDVDSDELDTGTGVGV